MDGNTSRPYLSCERCNAVPAGWLCSPTVLPSVCARRAGSTGRLYISYVRCSAYAAINVRRKSQQHLQALSLGRATRWQRHAVVPEVFADYATINVRMMSLQYA